MREHEVPTHVQAEDKVLLGFTFPQVVAVTAVCAISYGAYRYAPVGPSEVRMALAVVFGLGPVHANAPNYVVDLQIVQQNNASISSIWGISPHLHSL